MAQVVLTFWPQHTLSDVFPAGNVPIVSWWLCRAKPICFKLF